MLWKKILAQIPTHALTLLTLFLPDKFAEYFFPS